MAARLTAYVVVAIVAATLIAGLIVGAQRDDSDGPVDLIVTNATVYTADRRGTVAEAVAIRGNQILRVGTNREIARLQRPQTIVVDAEGGAVFPGFNDAHVDLIAGGLRLAMADLNGAATGADVLERIGAWSAANPGTGWVIGSGWSPEQFKNGLPTRQMLDAIVKDRPDTARESRRTIAGPLPWRFGAGPPRPRNRPGGSSFPIGGRRRTGPGSVRSRPQCSAHW